MDLDAMTHDELDALADERHVDPYPTSGIKADKVEAIRAADLPATTRAVANVPLSDWPRGEIREVPVDERLLRRAAAGTVTVLAADRLPAPATVDLDTPAAGEDLDLQDPLEDDEPEPDGEDVDEDAPPAADVGPDREIPPAPLY